MATSPPDPVRPAPRWKPLDARQRRVLGVLIEKAKTTPAGYPMSVNAIVAGCNQKSNRDPLMALDDTDVTNVLTELQTLEVVSEVDWLGRVPKYKHRAYDWLGVSPAEIAVMTELLLRGAQALGELRARAARMEPIADLAALKPIVDGLIARGLMVEITPPGRGQIVSHNLYTAPELAELRAQHGSRGGIRHPAGAGQPGTQHSPAPIATPPPSHTLTGAEPVTPGSAPDVLARLSSEIAELRAEVARLRERLAALEAAHHPAGDAGEVRAP